MKTLEQMYVKDGQFNLEELQFLTFQELGGLRRVLVRLHEAGEDARDEMAVTLKTLGEKIGELMGVIDLLCDRFELVPKESTAAPIVERNNHDKKLEFERNGFDFSTLVSMMGDQLTNIEQEWYQIDNKTRSMQHSKLCLLHGQLERVSVELLQEA